MSTRREFVTLLGSGGRLHAPLTDPLQSDLLHQEPSSPGL